MRFAQPWKLEMMTADIKAMLKESQMPLSSTGAVPDKEAQGSDHIYPPTVRRSNPYNL